MVNSTQTPDFSWPGLQKDIPESVLGHKDSVDHSQRLPFTLEDHLIDGSRPMKVIVAGMGYSGIIASIRIQQKMKNVTLQVYEKNDDVGGTWYENKYPNVACDIPAFCYQLTFHEKDNWSSFYAPGGEICEYLHEVVDRYKLRKFVQCQTEVIGATWNEDKGKWVIQLKRSNGETFQDECDVYIPATGFLNAWKWPDIPGIHDFKGVKEHSAHWEGKFSDLAGKRIAVIGNGSSAIQIIPGLAPESTHLDTYIRGPTWIALPFAGEEAVKRNPTGGNFKFSNEELQRFSNDKEYYAQYRRDLENELNSVHEATIKNSPMQNGARASFKDMMLEKLKNKKEVADFMIPDFPVACRRLTPGPNYLETLASEKVDVITTHINKITETGIEDKNGVHREYDAIICATGFDTTFKPRYSFIGRNGVDLRKKWAEQPNAYLAMVVDDFPNCFMVPGPNSGVGSGSLLVIFERQVDYVIKALQKMQKEQIKSIEVKKSICDDWSDYIDAYFEGTVYSEKCRTWYKSGREEGRVVGLWPGSCLHAVRALEMPRWEDYEYKSLSSQKNKLSWLGNGWTAMEKNKDGDRAFYLDKSEIDIPPVPEN